MMSWSIPVSPQSNNKCPIRDTHKGEGDMKTEAEIGMMLLEVKEHQ